MRPAKILLADDHAVILDSLRKILEDDFEIVGTVTDGRALLSAVDELHPDVVLVDISMPLLNGLDAARQIKKAHPGARIIFLTMHEDIGIAQQAMTAGASGYLLKHSPATKIVTAIQEVLYGGVHWPRFAASDVSGYLFKYCDPPKDLTAPLSMREREVLQLTAEGQSHKQVAATLNISIKTAQFHRQNIMSKLGLRTVAALTHYAVKQRIVNL